LKLFEQDNTPFPSADSQKAPAIAGACRYLRIKSNVLTESLMGLDVPAGEAVAER